MRRRKKEVLLKKKSTFEKNNTGTSLVLRERARVEQAIKHDSFAIFSQYNQHFTSRGFGLFLTLKMAAEVVLRPITTRRQRLKSVLHQTVLDGRYHQTQLLLGLDQPRHPPADVGCDEALEVSKQSLSDKVNAIDLNGRTPLMVALLLDDRRLAEKFVHLLLDNGANTYVEDRFGQTPLHYTTSFGLNLITDVFLQHDSFVPRNIVHVNHFNFGIFN